MKKILRPFIFALTLGLGLSSMVACAPRNPNRAEVRQHACLNCGYRSPSAGECPSCHVALTKTDVGEGN